MQYCESKVFGLTSFFHRSTTHFVQNLPRVSSDLRQIKKYFKVTISVSYFRVDRAKVLSNQIFLVLVLRKTIGTYKILITLSSLYTLKTLKLMNKNMLLGCFW